MIQPTIQEILQEDGSLKIITTTIMPPADAKKLIDSRKAQITSMTATLTDLQAKQDAIDTQITKNQLNDL